MAKLTIQRKNGLLYRGSSFKILVDGTELGTIKGKQTKEFPLSDGQHTLKIMVGWLNKYDTQTEFDSSADKIFQVSVNPVVQWTYVYVFVALLAKIILDSVVQSTAANPSKYQLFLFALPGLLVMLYYYTIARKKLLIVRESSELNLSLL